MQIINGDIFENITSGVIVHQVNCQNVFRSGFAKELNDWYPLVTREYHDSFKKYSSEDLFGLYQEVKVNNDLIIVNSFSQFNYGNSLKTKITYTNMDYLVATLKDLVNKYGTIYAPYKIGCGLAGGSWKELTDRIKDLNIIFYRIN